MNFRTLAQNTALMALAIALAIPTGRYAAKLYQQNRSHVVSGEFSQHVRDLPHKVTLYGTSTCKYCNQMRAYLHEKKIAYNDVRLENNKAAEMAFSQLNQTAVPVLVTETSLVTGFHAADVDELLKLNK